MRLGRGERAQLRPMSGRELVRLFTASRDSFPVAWARSADERWSRDQVKAALKENAANLADVLDGLDRGEAAWLAAGANRIADDLDYPAEVRVLAAASALAGERAFDGEPVTSLLALELVIAAQAAEKWRGSDA